MALTSGIGGRRVGPERGARVRGRSRAALGLLLAFLTACASPAPAPGPPPPPPAEPAEATISPLLWRATDPTRGAGAIYLFGSVHVGRPGPLAFDPAIRSAYASAEELVVEVNISSLSAREIATRAFEYVMLPPGETLRDRVAPSTFAALERRLAESGLAVEAVESMKPWAVTTMLAMAQFSEAGLHEEYGIDRHFISEATGDRPIRGLETLESQWRTFDDLSPEIQEMMLVDTLSRMDDDPGAMIDAWARGDEAALTRIVFGPLDADSAYAPFYDAIFFRRNEDMAASLVALSGDGKDRFVVLGTGHMLGPRGIPALLEERGFRVELVGRR